MRQITHFGILLFQSTSFCYYRLNVQNSFFKQRNLSVQFNSVVQSCPTLCSSMDCSTPGLPVHHQLRSLIKLMSTESVCHPTISSSVVPFSSCLQSFTASESFPMSQFFASGGQSIGVSASASVFPMNIQN